MLNARSSDKRKTGAMRAAIGKDIKCRSTRQKPRTPGGVNLLLDATSAQPSSPSPPRSCLLSCLVVWVGPYPPARSAFVSSYGTGSSTRIGTRYHVRGYGQLGHVYCSHKCYLFLHVLRAPPAVPSVACCSVTLSRFATRCGRTVAISTPRICRKNSNVKTNRAVRFSADKYAEAEAI